MAGEIQVDFTTGRNLYAQVRNANGLMWNTVGGAFEAYLTANIGDYDIVLSEQGTASQFYAGTFPALIPVGIYCVLAKDREGALPVESDRTIAGPTPMYWTGAALTFFPANMRLFSLDASGRVAVAPTGLGAVVPTAPTTKPTIGTSSIVDLIGFTGALAVWKTTSDGASVDLWNGAGTSIIVSWATSDSAGLFTSGAAA